VNFFSDLETLRRFNWALIFVENYFRQNIFCENNFQHFLLYGDSRVQTEFGRIGESDLEHFKAF